MSCHHLVRCAVTGEERKRAVAMMRSGITGDYLIGAMAITGPCTDESPTVEMVAKTFGESLEKIATDASHGKGTS